MLSASSLLMLLSASSLFSASLVLSISASLVAEEVVAFVPFGGGGSRGSGGSGAAIGSGGVVAAIKVDFLSSFEYTCLCHSC